ncbi:MAG TPA: HAD family hydrolase [Acidimicrobiales bacterium]|nr:HAD family hydrolase [Acidimicrobiales bacterium]
MVRRLLLWDIDGTLVRAGLLGAEVFDRALEDVLGEVPPGRVRMSGKTDPLIVHEQLALLGLEPDPTTVEAVLDRLVARLAEVAHRLPGQGTPCPGVPELLEALGGDPAVASGVLTGNLRPNAEVKLAAFGLDRLVDLRLGAYGSDDIDRNALVPIARKRATEHLGAEVAADDTWVIGDTPRDLECARRGGVRCLLVGTGTYDVSELGSLGADVTLPDLTDTATVLELLAGAA